MTKQKKIILPRKRSQSAKDLIASLIESFGEHMPTEHCEMVLFAKYLRAKNLFWLHVPNEGKRSIVSAKQLSDIGLLKGAADVLIMQSPPKYPEAKGVAIEMKRIKGGKLSAEQETFLSDASRHGWITYVARGWQDGVKFLNTIGW